MRDIKSISNEPRELVLVFKDYMYNILKHPKNSNQELHFVNLDQEINSGTSVKTVSHSIIRRICTQDPKNYNFSHLVLIITSVKFEIEYVISLINEFVRTMRPFIEEGRLLIVKPPLYKVFLRKSNLRGSIFLFSEKDLNDYLFSLETMQINRRQIRIFRYHSLGELQPEEIEQYCLDQHTRFTSKVHCIENSKSDWLLIDRNKSFKPNVYDIGEFLHIEKDRFRIVPDIRDGLRPVHRRILWATHTLIGNSENKKIKISRIVGETRGKYEPNFGMQAYYDELDRLTNKSRIRYPFFSKHDDNQSVMTLEFLGNLTDEISQNTCEFKVNMDGTEKELMYFSSKIPLILIIGSMDSEISTNTYLPSHNLTEVMEALIQMIEDPSINDEALMKIITGPDFPNGGVILDNGDIKSLYTKGRGTVTLQSRYSTDYEKNTVIIDEIPFLVSRTQIIEELNSLIEKDKIRGLISCDESINQTLELKIKPEHDKQLKNIIQIIFEKTSLEITFDVILKGFDGEKEKVFNLKEILSEYLKFRTIQFVAYKETNIEQLQNQLNKIRISNTFRRLLKETDIEEDIRQSASTADAAHLLNTKYSLEEDVVRIMLDRKITPEFKNAEYQSTEKTQNKILHIQGIISNEKLVIQQLKLEFQKIKNRFGDKRKTSILREDI